MNRVLKFRVWDDSRKKMYVANPDMGRGMATGWVHFMVIEGVLVAENYDTQNILRRLEIMQSTGSKDKNNIDIYEGDIVKYNCQKDHFENIVVRWCELEGLDMIGFENLNGGEVIGNIYENIELIPDI